MEINPNSQTLSPSDLFRLWASKIEKNSPEDFAGVFLIIPPNGEPISSLLIDKEKDMGTFFALVKSKLDDAVDAVNEKQKRQASGFR